MPAVGRSLHGSNSNHNRVSGVSEIDRVASYEVEALREKVKYLTAAMELARVTLAAALPHDWVLPPVRRAGDILRTALLGEWKP